VFDPPCLKLEMRASVLAPDRQTGEEDHVEDGKERTRRSFSEAKEAKTQCRQEDVRIFPRCRVIDAGKEEEDFKSDVWL